MSIQACILGCSTLSTMTDSARNIATRAFVSVLLALARMYDICLSVTRDSAEDKLRQAYKKVLLKAHPDKGGRKEDMQKLQGSKEAWDVACTCSLISSRTCAFVLGGDDAKMTLSRDESFIKIDADHYLPISPPRFLSRGSSSPPAG